jgi:phosphate starvation-inducible membrane PsiE
MVWKKDNLIGRTYSLVVGHKLKDLRQNFDLLFCVYVGITKLIRWISKDKMEFDKIDMWY